MDLLTTRLRLREQELSDAMAAHAYEHRDDVMRYQTPPPRTLEESRGYIERILAEQSRAPRLVYDLAVTLRSGSPMIGRVGIALDGVESCPGARLWYVLSPEHQGQGLATEAVREITRFAFQGLGLHRLIAEVDPRNTPSVKLLERLHFRREALHLQNIVIKGELCDTLIYAQLHAEFSAKLAST